MRIAGAGGCLWSCSGRRWPGAPETSTRAGSGRDTVRIVVVTHGQSSDPSGPSWPTARRTRREELGVRVEYQAPTSFDMVRMSQLIEAAVASRPSALAISVPDPDALGPSMRAAVAAGIPALSINSGDQAWERLGLPGPHRPDRVRGGRAAGERLAAGGAQAGALRESRGRQRLARPALPRAWPTGSQGRARRCRCSA